MITVYKSVFLKDGPGNMTGNQKDKLDVILPKAHAFKKSLHLKKNPTCSLPAFAAAGCVLLWGRLQPVPLPDRGGNPGQEPKTHETEINAG